MTDSARVYITSTPAASGSFYLLSKRIFDLLIALVLLVALLPLLMFISILIALDSPGSVLFLQERVGRNGKRFQMWKFRTMRADHDSKADREYMASFVAGSVTPTLDCDGTQTFKPAHSAHITRVGRLLRKTSLDELPQLWNIIRGDMSLIGPRPNVTWEVEMYADWHRKRLQVLPGITGLAQVRGRSNISFDRIVEYDLAYISNQSFKLDLMIIWWTIEQVLARRDAA